MAIAERNAQTHLEGRPRARARAGHGASGALDGAAGDVGLADRALGRSDEPRGADRRGALLVLRDGALATS